MSPGHLPPGVANTPAAIRGDVRKTLAKSGDIDAKKDHFTPVLGAHSRISIGKVKHTTGTKIRVNPMTENRHDVDVSGLKNPQKAATVLRERGYQIPDNHVHPSSVTFTVTSA